MESRSNIWNFDEVNSDKKFSLFSRLIVMGLVLIFLIAPLSTISPETFVIPKSILYLESCGCLVPCH